MTKETIKKWLEKNPPAFPANLHGESGLEFSTPGITIRDYFAAAALQGFAANSAYNDRSFEQTAEMSYEQADAMLNERGK